MAANRFENDEAPEGFCPLAPDLAVKVGEYLQAGVRLVWVIDPNARRATGYGSLNEVRTLGSNDDLDGEDVVPGFRCPLREIL